MFPPSIGILIENPSFISNYTGFENLKTLASIRERIDDNKIRQTLTEVGLELMIREHSRNIHSV